MLLLLLPGKSHKMQNVLKLTIKRLFYVYMHERQTGKGPGERERGEGVVELDKIVNSFKFFKSRTTLKLVMHLLVASRRSCLFAT